MRNERDIAAVTADLKESRTHIWNKLETIENKVNEIQVAVATLVVKSEYHPKARRGSE